MIWVLAKHMSKWLCKLQLKKEVVIQKCEVVEKDIEHEGSKILIH